jgi:hypothetical protein
MSGGTALLRGSFGAARVTETAPVHGNSLGYAAGSNFTANKTDALLASLGIPRQTVEDNFNPGFAASFSSVPHAFAGTRVPSGSILHRIAPFSSTLILIASGLVGLAGLRYRRRRG